MRNRYVKGRQPLTIVGLLFILFLPLFDLSLAGEIVLTSVGSGQWQVNSSNLANVQALDLDLRYDQRRLTGAMVTVGAGVGSAITALNDKTPGIIRLAVASTQSLPQSGLLLKIQTSAPGSELWVTTFTAKAVDGEGKSVPTSVRQLLAGQSILPASPPVTTDSSSQTMTIAPSDSRRHTGTTSGSVILPETPTPTPVMPQKTGREATAPQPARPVGNKGSTISESATTIPASLGAEKRYHSQEEIVALIAQLPKPWTVTTIKSIFLKAPSASQVRQEPRVALADGRSHIKLFLPKSLSKFKPTIGTQGVTLGAIWDADEQGWQIDLTTKKNTWPAIAMLLGEKELIKFPVVIVPPLKITPPEKDDAPLSPADFDEDGRITATDAYLFVGNLLAVELR